MIKTLTNIEQELLKIILERLQKRKTIKVSEINANISAKRIYAITESLADKLIIYIDYDNNEIGLFKITDQEIKESGFNPADFQKNV